MGLQLGDRVPQFRLPAGDHHDVCAGPGQGGGDGPADAGAAAGDQRDTAVEEEKIVKMDSSRGETVPGQAGRSDRLRCCPCRGDRSRRAVPFAIGRLALHAIVAETVSIALLLAVLVFAVARPRGLPVSNLTNLLAFAASGLSFVRFAGYMALPWLVAIAVEYAVFRWYFGGDLAVTPGGTRPVGRPRVPVFTVVVLALTLAGFAVTSLAGVNPAWAALAGALVLAVRGLRQRRTSVRGLVAAAGPLFCLFGLALGVVVKAVVVNGLDRAADRVLPHGSGLLALLAVAGVAALLANLINNLPAVLAMLPLVAWLGPRSLAPPTRFVVDHAPCRVLLAWPQPIPDLESLPPPPPG
jgi:hypothetical protein